jgi:uncharacterized membrane protein
MNPAHFHLLLNHLPILGTLFALILLLFGLMARNRTLIHTGLITAMVSAVFTFPVVASGEGAEEIVEKMGIDHKIIHEHEEIAETAALLNYFLGVLALISLILSWANKKIANYLNIITLAYGCVVFAFMVQAGNSGGQISHPEIRKSFNPDSTPAKKDTQRNEKADDD